MSQYNSKFNMQSPHAEKTPLIELKARHPVTPPARPSSAADVAAFNKHKARHASVRLYQEV